MRRLINMLLTGHIRFKPGIDKRREKASRVAINGRSAHSVSGVRRRASVVLPFSHYFLNIFMYARGFVFKASVQSDTDGQPETQYGIADT